MKKRIYNCLLLVFLVFANGFLQAQDTISNTKASRLSYAEKVYLQLSSTVFTAGETIWYKAIVTNAINHQPTKLSGILYVDLIDFDKNIINTKKLSLKNGVSDNFFLLNKNLPTGEYLIRAYTAWNKNFGQDFIFKQKINLLSPNAIDKEEIIQNITLTETNKKYLKLSAILWPEQLKTNYNKSLTVYIETENQLDSLEINKQDNQYQLNYVLPKDAVTAKIKLQLADTKLKNKKFKTESSYSKTVVINKYFLDLQFLPEGGKLVNGLKSRLAFKAINFEGLGTPISGYIFDDSDSPITSFKTNDLGMGFVDFIPDSNKSYYGKVSGENNTIYKYPLPKIYQEGFVLSALELKDHFSIKAKSNIDLNDNIFVDVKSRGVLLKRFAFKMKAGFHEVLIEKNILPNGIINIILLNKNKEPLSERLIFNFNENSLLNISASINKDSYNQREKVKLNFKILNLENKFKGANLSALIIDKIQLEDFYKQQPNILSYFFLNSELKGTVENPNHYFKDSNMFRKRDLDALMLTQGWRQYLFKKDNDNYSFDARPEKNLFVSGYVKSNVDKNKVFKKGIDLTLITFGNDRDVFMQTTDSLGRFDFDIGTPYSDKLKLVFQTANSKGKAKDYDFILDDSPTAPDIVFTARENMHLVDSIGKSFLQKRLEQQNSVEDFKKEENTIDLDAVELQGYNLTPVRKMIMERHGMPDVFIENADLVEGTKKWSSGLFSILNDSFRDDIVIERVGLRLFERQKLLDFNIAGLAFPELNYDQNYLELLQTDPNAVIPSQYQFDVANVAGSVFTFILVDGIPVRIPYYPLIPYMDSSEIKSFEIIREPTEVNRYTDLVFEGTRLPFSPLDNISIINIITYSGIGFTGSNATKGIYNASIAGFSDKKEFYTPKYDNLKAKDWEVPDLRSVIHWSPNIFADEKGQAQIEFYNADSIGDMLVVIEAIAPDGKMGYFETTYNVSKKFEK